MNLSTVRYPRVANSRDILSATSMPVQSTVLLFICALPGLNSSKIYGVRRSSESEATSCGGFSSHGQLGNVPQSGMVEHRNG